MQPPDAYPLDSSEAAGDRRPAHVPLEPLFGQTLGMDPLREEADRIVAQLPPQARRHLVDLLGNVLNILDNIDVICPKFYPPCRGYMRFERLRALHAALTDQSRSPQPSGD